MQARRIARELALLSLSQLPRDRARLKSQDLNQMVLAAVRALTAEARDALEDATAELKNTHESLLDSDTRASTLQSARAMIEDAVNSTRDALNRLGIALDLPEFIQLANQDEVRAYALEVVEVVCEERDRIDRLLSDALVDWQLNRLAHIDQDILRIAVAEMIRLDVPNRIAINEAVELAKRYSGEDGHRFINGVLRRTMPQVQAAIQANV